MNSVIQNANRKVENILWKLGAMVFEASKKGYSCFIFENWYT